MVILRKNIVAFWATEPALTPVPEKFMRDGWFVGFPDMDTLSPAEKMVLRPVIERHPEYLQHEIWCEETIQ